MNIRLFLPIVFLISGSCLSSTELVIEWKNNGQFLICTNLRQPDDLELSSEIRASDLSKITFFSVPYGYLIEPPDIIEKFINLEKLFIRNASLEDFNISGKNFKKLEYVFLGHNSLSAFPRYLYGYKTVIDLRLSYNAILNIHEGISTLKNLVNLHLNGNRIKGLPNDFHEMNSLKLLDLSENVLSNGSLNIENLGKLESIESLFLSDNLLEHIPKKWLKNKTLALLNLSFNHISDVPDYGIVCKNLESITLKGNKLKDFSGVLAMLPKGDHPCALYLEGNRIEHIPDSVKFYKNILYLHLRVDQITPFKNLSYQLPSLSESLNI